MSKKKKDQFNFNSTNFINYLWNLKGPLVAISLVAALISAIVALSITPKFKSTVVMFPTSSSSVSKGLLAESPMYPQDVLEFGEEEESEQLMQILNSEQIKANIIRKFNLYEHYELDSSAKFVKTKLQQIYKKNIKFRRTEYMSVVVDVLDTDPKMAADIANEIAAQVDTVMNKMRKERALKALVIVEQEYRGLEDEIKHMEDSLSFIMKAGVMDYESQAQVYNDAYAKALADGKLQGARTLEKKLNVLATYGSTYVSLRDLLKAETERLSLLRQKYMEAKVDAEQNLPHTYIVDRAYESEKKAYPIRSLIVLVSTISAFFLALLAFVIRDSIKH
jgi:uncharacterized protein involved in exopolysaccharide biosynthesis